MKRTVIAATVLMLLLVSLGSAEQMRNIDQQAYLDRPSFVGWVPNRFIVVLTDDVTVDHAKDMRSPMALSSIAGFDQLARDLDVAQIRPQFPGSDRMQNAAAASDRALSRYYKVYLNGDNLDAAVAAYEANPMVERVERIGVHTVFATPNDTYYDNPPPTYPYDQWHYWDTYGVNAHTAWDTETGAQSVIVGDLDIGTKYDHGDLGGSNPPGPNDASTNGNIWINTNEVVGNGVDDDGNGYVDDILGWDFVERTDWYSYACIDADCGGADNDPSDGDGHGTHTAGTIAAITNNGYAVAGVAGGYGDGTFAGGGNGVKVVPCRIGYVLDYFIYGPTGVVIMDYVAEAMYYMADLKLAGWNVAAINCSFGSSNSGGLAAATDFLIAQDVIVVVAAGNSNSTSPSYLGSRGDCVDVGATDQSGNVASFSNYGSWVDIAAPGVSVLSTITDPADPTGDYVAVLDGTSMAAPHVTGVLALLESYDPSLSAADKIALITDPNNVKSYNGTKDVGVGIVDVRACLDAIGPTNNPPVAAFTGAPTSGLAPLFVQFTDQSTNTPTSWSWDFGDGNTSTAQSPSHTYTNPGSYTVSLTATNAFGSDAEVKTSYITVTAPQPPTADFSGSPTSGAYPLNVQFTDLSTNDPTSWSWDFGDGGTSTAQNPSHTYTAVGMYTVSLTASNAYGSDVATRVDYITVTEPAPTSQAFALSDIPNLGTVSGSYLNTNGSDNVYETLTEAISDNHPRKTTSWLAHSWNFNLGSGGSSVMFYMEGYRTSGDGDNFVFEYSTDQSTWTGLFTVASATEQVYSATLPSGLSGTVWVRVYDTDRNWGNTALDNMVIDNMYFEMSSSAAPPVADFVGSPTSGNTPLNVQFTDLSSNAPTGWSWTFGDGGTSTAQNPSHTYTAAGVYTVSLTATNAYGSDAVTKTNYITVTDPPTGGTMHVAGITASRKSAGTNCSGVATVVIEDNNNARVASATVTVSATGPVSGTYSGVTDATGTVVIETGKTKSCSGEWCFTVTNVTHATLTYDPGSNGATTDCENSAPTAFANGDGIMAAVIPNEFGLGQNYPNPFNPTTEISFSLPVGSSVTLEVFNIRGQRVAVLADGVFGAGTHTVTWDASAQPSGVYLYRIITDEFTDSQKMLLLK